MFYAHAIAMALIVVYVAVLLALFYNISRFLKLDKQL
jgi:hypothetical protein